MSADNGYILRKTSRRKFVLQQYSASADAFPNIADAKPDEIFETMSEAVIAFQELDRENHSEYGLRVDVSKTTVSV